jgi:hypothetical protein
MQPKLNPHITGFLNPPWRYLHCRRSVAALRGRQLRPQ